MTSTEFSKELESHKDLLFAFALKTTRDYQDAQDLFQEALTRAYRYRLTFQTGTNFRAWMATIIRNTFVDSVRRRKKKQLASDPIEDIMHVVDVKFNTFNSGERDVQYNEMFESLDCLNEIYRIPFLMHYRGYEYKEIAEALSIPLGTVKSRLNTARHKIKKSLANRHLYSVAK